MDPRPALRQIAAEEGVAILLAVESGSRAWGFPSPDSDWDVRFLYAQPTGWHLRVSPGRDVIERSLPGDLDLSGWDMRKTLGLVLRGNCTVREWLASPVQYASEDRLTAALRELAERVPARRAALHHYTSLAVRVRGRWLGRPVVNYKKYLYAIRPALVLRWLRLHPAGTAPMDLPSLLAAAALPPEQQGALGSLLAAKAVMSEIGAGPPLAPLDQLLDEEVGLAQAAIPAQPPVQPDAAALAFADSLLRASAAFCDAELAASGEHQAP